MLQTNKTSPLVSEVGQQVGIEHESIAEILASFLAFVRRQARLIFIPATIVVLLGLVYLLTARPSYTAEALLLIDSRKNQLFQQQSVIGDFPIDAAAVESQIEVIKSENIAHAVIKNLGLASDPEFIGSGGWGLGSLYNSLTLLGGREKLSEADLLRSATEMFKDRLSVKRVGLSYVIQVKFTAPDAKRAAEITNAVVETYITDQLDAKYQATRRAGTWLQDRIRELRDQASAAEQAVVEFKTQNNIVTTGGSNTSPRLMGEQQVAELTSQLIIARSQMAEAKARLDRIETVLSADPSSVTVNATVADTLKSEVITKLRSQYLDIANREADWSARYGANHLAAVNLRNQMREIRNSILDELRRIAEVYKSDYQIAKQREDELQRELARAVDQSQITNKAQVALRELESNSQTYRTLYDNFLQRYMESVQQQSFPITEARNISEATPPSRKSHPNALIVLGIATLGGLVLGLGCGLMRELSDRAFRTSEQVEDLLGEDCLTLVPLVLGKMRGDRDAEVPTRVGDRAIVRNGGVYWSIVDAPLSRFAESMRAIKLAADLQAAANGSKVFGLTSSIPDEGKSTVSASLALLMSQAGARTLLIDCDLRNPALSRSLSPAATLGILELMEGQATLDQVLWKEAETGLSFIPAVSPVYMAHSSALLGSEAMTSLFKRLRSHYDYIVVDLSPLMPIVDVRATNELIDSYVFVIEWGRTKYDIVQKALTSAQGIRNKILGVVLNKTNMKLLKRFEQYTGSYYHNKNFERYS
jgi:succinoglycan biosynthesis transport protein ExoP